MMYEELLSRKADLAQAVDDALKPLLQALGGQTIYLLNQWDLRDPMDSESDMAESVRFVQSDGHLIATLDSSEGSEQVSALSIENGISLLAELEQGNYQTVPLDETSDEPEEELPYSVHEGYNQE